MSKVHFLNVTPGDCSIIEHNSGRTSVIDVCSGNIVEERLLKEIFDSIGGNYSRAKYPTNPIDYMRRIGVQRIFRFISTHPDMDHLDGFDALASAFDIDNFWHAGVEREKPPFEGGRYEEKDWDRYVALRDGLDGTHSRTRLAGDLFRYANQNAEDSRDIDGLHILAPTPALVAQALQTDDLNDASYVILYRTIGGHKILFTGDAHDDTFSHLLAHRRSDIANCSVLIAPHHGRQSDRDFAFLDVVRPVLTLFGCAPSEHLAYGAWHSRGLKKITSNQAGDVVLEIGADGVLHVYIENQGFARDDGGDVQRKNAQGYYWYGMIGNRLRQKAAAAV